jgi:hypothetical protein
MSYRRTKKIYENTDFDLIMAIVNRRDNVVYTVFIETYC